MEPSQVTIEILADETRCVVRGVEMNCSDVVAYLRDSLKLLPGHPVAVKGPPTVDYEPIRTLFDGLKAAGFGLRVAYL
jgi:hypothetical protein